MKKYKCPFAFKLLVQIQLPFLLTGLWPPRVLSLLAGLFVSLSASSQLARGRAEARQGALQGEVRPAPSSFTQFLSSARGEADSSVVQSSSMKTCQGKAEQGAGFGFLAMESPIDFSCTGFFFLLLAAQSTSLKEAQEIFKSKQ